MRRILKTALVAACGLGMTGGMAQAVPFGVSLGNNGRTLVSIADFGNPTSLSGVAITDGLGQAISLSSITYRPSNGALYGYSDQTNAIYQVSRATGVATIQPGFTQVTGVPNTGADFNNQIDALRIVSIAEDNLVWFPNNTPPNSIRATNLFYGASDVNFGEDPSIFANAYTNAVPGPASTLQFALDAQNDSLVTLANNAGTLGTVGQLAVDGVGLDFTSAGGFDILSLVEGDNTAFALLTTAEGMALYTLALSGSGGQVATVRLGGVGTQFGNLTSLAVFDVAAVPVPAALPLLGTALGLMALLRRRRAVA